jgi:PPOX class probable F420-dependent enzyme
MSVTIPESARELIESASLAHLVTLNRDGSAQVSCVWIGFDTVTDERSADGANEVCFASLDDRIKLKNLRRDPRVTLSVEQAGGPNEWGLVPYLVLTGRARITEGGAPALLQHLAHTYLGPDETFPPMPDPPPGFVVRIAVDRIGGIGPWAG